MVGQASMSEADSTYLRKIRKPLVEKRRRDRMNVSIDRLRALLATACPNDSSISRVDKAEVLDQAVRYLTCLQQRPSRHTTSGGVMPGAQTEAYKAGFRECTRETIRYLDAMGTYERNSIKQLGHHLLQVCDAKTGSAVFQPSRSRFPSPLPLHTSSTPLSTRDSLLRLPDIAFHHSDSYSPDMRASMMLPRTPQWNLVGRYSDSPPLFGSVSPTSSVGSFCDVSSSTSANAMSEDSLDLSLKSSHESSTGSAGCDVSLDVIIKEEQPWRPW
ncbi:enhancer of split m8 protein-like [Dreissena polymorpha]|uniref:Uncharacterized protein n=1 Tax=Dreissena polymorpha TaxID=45954 RepID=A0A9D4EKN9_DREPO|nr:enhancer of split m8 protein-like [Dreissena polymorpha]KAH3780251.1 hypothetical protein DPMN_158061 [Dreissena polymorpha]